jgi:hypothetical protein
MLTRRVAPLAKIVESMHNFHFLGIVFAYLVILNGFRKM